MGSRAGLLFQSIEAPPTPWSRWATSLVIHAAFAALVVTIPLGVNRAFVARQPDLRVQLVAPPPVKRNVTRPPLSAPKPLAETARIKPQKFAIPKAEIPKIERAKIEPPKIEPPKIESAI